MISFYVSRDAKGRAFALYRVVDGASEQWTPQGWEPQHFDYSGIGGATEYDAIEVEDAVMALVELGADDLNPVPRVSRTT